MRSRRNRGISPISLRECYAQRGSYTVKMLIDPTLSQELEGVAVEIRNADGLPMIFDSKRWGTKLTLSFVIDDRTPDGLSVIDILMRKFKDGQVSRERFDFWVVKE